MYGYTVFHEDTLNTLIRSVREGTSSSAYIFEGAKGLGTANAASLFAKTLLCLEHASAPCSRCGPCLEADTGANPDLIRITKPKDRASLGVDAARNIINTMLTKPLFSHRRAVIIEDGGLLTVEAQNALLKILEEPPEYAVFIIICQSAENILETVRSRSVTIEFPPVGDDIVRKYITEKYPDEPRVDFLVKYCAGIPMAADGFIGSDTFEAMRADALSLTEQLLSQNKLQAFPFSAYFDSHKDTAADICDMILLYLRDIIVSISCGTAITNTDKADAIHKLASKHTAAETMAAADEMIVMKKMLAKSVKASAAAMHAALSC